jgi:glucokinase
MPVVLALDIGGTKLAAALVHTDGTLEGRRLVPTVTGSDPEALFTVVARLCRQVLDGGGGDEPVALGIGCGGPMDLATGRVSPLNIPAWRDFPLRDRLAAELGLPVFLDNDAKALARGEGWRGAAVGQANFIAMVVSTGVGAGVYVDGRLLDGATGNAGHIGHVIVEPEGHLCPCGARGCLEGEVSGSALARHTGRPAAEADESTRRRVGTLVGRAVAGTANLLDIRLAVVAGSVALGFGEPFFAAAQDELDRSARLAFSVGVRIVPGALGADGPLVGAAAVALAGLELSTPLPNVGTPVPAP